LITPRRHIIITDSRYWVQVKEESTFELVKYVPPRSFLDTVVELIRNLDLRKLALEKSESLQVFTTHSKKSFQIVNLRIYLRWLWM